MQSLNEIILKLEELNIEYTKLCKMLEYEEVLSDKKLFLHLDKKKNNLTPIVTKFQEYLVTKNNIEELNKIIKENSHDRNEFLSELNKEEQKQTKIQQELIKLHNEQDANEETITIEIINTKTELSLKLSNFLFSCYSNFLKNNMYSFTYSNNKNTIFNITGENVYKIFETEIGTHKIIDKTKEDICQVFVFKNIKEEKYLFAENELEISSCRSSGAGGQHINKTESAIKIVHLPTGLVGISQDERSQFQNKQKAIERLKQKVHNFTQEKIEKSINSQKKEQLKQINRIIKIYNLDTQKVVNNNKQELTFSSFLNGNF